eukprot:5357402-Prymnesium_polylepis.1
MPRSSPDHAGRSVTRSPSLQLPGESSGPPPRGMASRDLAIDACTCPCGTLKNTCGQKSAVEQTCRAHLRSPAPAHKGCRRRDRVQLSLAAQRT